MFVVNVFLIGFFLFDSFLKMDLFVSVSVSDGSLSFPISGPDRSCGYWNVIPPSFVSVSVCSVSCFGWFVHGSMSFPQNGQDSAFSVSVSVFLFLLFRIVLCHSPTNGQDSAMFFCFCLGKSCFCSVSVCLGKSLSEPHEWAG